MSRGTGGAPPVPSQEGIQEAGRSPIHVGRKTCHPVADGASGSRGGPLAGGGRHIKPTPLATAPRRLSPPRHHTPQTLWPSVSLPPLSIHCGAPFTDERCVSSFSSLPTSPAQPFRQASFSPLLTRAARLCASSHTSLLMHSGLLLPGQPGQLAAQGSGVGSSEESWAPTSCWATPGRPPLLC